MLTIGAVIAIMISVILIPTMIARRVEGSLDAKLPLYLLVPVAAPVLDPSRYARLDEVSLGLVFSTLLAGSDHGCSIVRGG